ncbi:MAG: TAXI family TRAP transporter solute-binding subunit [Gammaproteobacteria bacterium]|nr:TAXI family TRAP transporter solute-binding subunit [Gammaproteobacteria bacterium]
MRESSTLTRNQIFLISIIFCISPLASAEQILVGSGNKAGVYYQAGRAICRLLNRKTDDIRCEVRPTAGSSSNLGNVQRGAIELGIAQSDTQFYAHTHTGIFEYDHTQYDQIRSLFSLHSEPFTLVARRDAKIKNLDDLVGRRVNIGNPGSGQRGTMDVVMDAKGWTKNDFSLTTELPLYQQSLALCHNRVQAMVYTVGHPNASLSKAAGLCDAVIVPVEGEDIDKLVERFPYYSHTIIPGGMYNGNTDLVETFGVVATVVSSAEVDEELVYNIVKTLFENLKDFRRMHSAFGTLTPENMIKDGLSAPLHEGAKRYYREMGWLEAE